MEPSDVAAAFNASTFAARIHRGVPQGQAKRQHYTPQFLLRGFLHGDGGRLSQLEVRTGQVRPADVSTAASKKRFYSLRDGESGERDETIEGLFGIVEDGAAPLVDEVIRGKDGLSPDDRVTLAYLVASQLVRTPSAMARMEAVTRVVHITSVARLVTDEAAFAEAYATVLDETGSRDPEWLRDWMREALLDERVRIANVRELSLGLMVELLDEQAQLLFQLPWSLLASDGERAFVTSDSGIGVIDRGPPISQASVLGTADARLFMPLSAGICVQIGPLARPTFELPKRELAVRECDDVNLATYGWATRFLFAGRQVDAQNLRALAKRASGRVARPRPFEQYQLIDRDPVDDSLAVAHRRVGRAPYILHEGVEHDYIVLRDDKALARDALRVAAISRSRAEARFGTSDLRSGSAVISPLDVSPATDDDQPS